MISLILRKQHWQRYLRGLVREDPTGEGSTQNNRVGLAGPGRHCLSERLPQIMAFPAQCEVQHCGCSRSWVSAHPGHFFPARHSVIPYTLAPIHPGYISHDASYTTQSLSKSSSKKMGFMLGVVGRGRLSRSSRPSWFT